MRQEKDETLTKFIERARKMLKEKNAIYNYLTEEQREEHSDLARRAFVRGVKSEGLRNRLMNNGASSLEDAIAFALEAENNSLSLVPRQELYCRTCRINGHRENQCRRREYNSSDIGRLASALRSLNTTPGRPLQNNRFTPRSNGWNRSAGQNFNRNWSGPNSNRFNNNNFGRNMNNNIAMVTTQITITIVTTAPIIITTTIKTETGPTTGLKIGTQTTSYRIEIIHPITHVELQTITREARK